ncbi:mitochondrial glycoprotein [Tanacetum coccineum]
MKQINTPVSTNLMMFYKDHDVYTHANNALSDLLGSLYPDQPFPWVRLPSQCNEEMEGGSLGDFVVDWDLPHSKDAILRKNYKSSKEVAISALLGDEAFLEVDGYPNEAEMKVCI